MNREQRRKLKKRLAPIAKRVVELEKNIKNNYKKEESEQEISSIMSSLSMIEMAALEDYITEKRLLEKV
jgi:hypothetical protein